VAKLYVLNSSFFSANGRIRRGELPNSSFILSSLSAIFRALCRNPDEANAYDERLSPVMDELNLSLAA